MNQAYCASILPMPRTAIEKLVPFGTSWLMVDEVITLQADRIQTRKTLAHDDPFITGHFADGPRILPGVLLIEFISQSAYLLGVLSAAAKVGDDARPRMLARCNASFLSPAYAGDTLVAEVIQLECINDVTLCEASVSCGDRPICRARVFGVSARPQDQPA
nr:hypothetical protein [uncultured Duganella sp.]